ncbi:M48 family metallopeptidase [Sneathiella sp. HT1-7]|uniref:M48 family metallopeptidase n=1 Tax=Sneathiella sp. HT1-7 TaxID=2887192 RepID=UPI001D147394|nr:M48 family metallopeptidase [Sneathiella sp. HT1-7]MCC3305481.1 M48 family metalloprotease [Sneathiella sp. HT1-7]
MRLGKAAVGLSLLVSACAGTGQVGDVKPGDEPELTTVEAGLRMKMDEAERSFAASALIIKDPELQNYLDGVVCRLAEKICPDIRLYIVKIPYFNASMAPNGVMQVWTGLLLRVENEAQLATVLAHELAHYKKRHSIKMWNSARNTTDFLAFFSIATGGIGYGFVGLAAGLGAAGSIQAYSRDLENEADEIGQDYLYDAGYDPAEAGQLWEKIKGEAEAGDRESTAIFFASHPPAEDRIENLKSRAEAYPARPLQAQQRADDKFRKLVDARWQSWVEDLIDTGSYEETLFVIDNLETREFSPAALDFYRGDVYRRRSNEGDLDKAKEAYLMAAKFPEAPAKTYKNLGLVAKRQKEDGKAIEYLEIYLARYPEASDRFLVESYIKQLRES